MFGARPIAAVGQHAVGRVRAIGAWPAWDAQRRPVRQSAASLHLGGVTQLHGAYPRLNGRPDMKINFRQRDASLPQEDDWSQTGDWLAELGDDNHTELPGDDHAEPDGTNDPWPAALAEADAGAPWPAALAEADAGHPWPAALAEADAGHPWPAARAEADARARAAARAEAPEEEETATTPSAVMTTRLDPEPDQLAVTPGPVPVNLPTVLPRNRPRPLEVAQCSLCGIALPLAFMVPDGGQACTDIRWYCKDAMSCTHRWTTANTPGQTHMATAPDDAVAGTREAAPGRASAEQTDGMIEAAQSAV